LSLMAESVEFLGGVARADMATATLTAMATGTSTHRPLIRVGVAPVAGAEILLAFVSTGGSSGQVSAPRGLSR